MTKQLLFTQITEKDDCGVIIYDGKRNEKQRIPFPKENRIGKLHRMEVTAELGKGSLYQFWEGERRLPDPKAKALFSAKKYGEAKSPEDVFGVTEVPDFDWKRDKKPEIPYSQCVIYCLHVRGFSKHSSSNVKNKGTFQGLTEKISYLKKLGVTTLEFQPIYEFIEKKKIDSNSHEQGGAASVNPRLNYWGYEKGYYFAPKSAYASGEPTTECKEMIRQIHEAGMEVVLQFYFPPEVNPMEIPEILRYWVEEYHVDGFHLIGENLPSELIARDPELSDSKIWYYQFEPDAIYGKRNIPNKKNLALLRDDFMYEGRKFLKGDENLVPAMMHHLRSVPAALGKINYLSTYWGFTLMDAVSYDFKHNEANGEDNHDGTDYNCSWNCGEEGPSRKKRIRDLRIRQLKNALFLLFFAQGTPRIFMGDEFGNSQKGNNNPYCQDNEVTWLNWSLAEKNKELLDFFVYLSAMRRSNPVLRPEKEATMMDSISCGYPDLSFHGETAWRPQMESYGRILGVAYCGLYGTERLEDLGVSYDETAEREEFIYLGINMHWEPHRLGLPRLPKGKRWTLKISSFQEENGTLSEPDFATIPPKTISLFVSRTEENGKKDNENEISQASDALTVDGKEDGQGDE